MTQYPNDTPSIIVELTEWDSVGPEKDMRLRGINLADGLEARQIADRLRGRLDIRERYDGLEITSTSFVGRIDVGPVRIAIRPKLPAMPLARLLRYAYGLSDVSVVGETEAPTAKQGLHELLVELLLAEVQELLHRGLVRRYIPVAENLESPRGRIQIDQLVRRGGVREARLPCSHFKRNMDWHLNQVLRAGLEAGARIAENQKLRRRAHQLSSRFEDIERLTPLLGSDIDKAEQELTRMTIACKPALTIIRLLHEELGIGFNSGQPSSRMPGFLFDMNIFFQRLLSRFLRNNLKGAQIADEQAIQSLFSYAPDANPKRRKAPAPRPDFALFHDKKLHGFLDAKYRDIWERGFPATWLYQLSIYALASPCEVSVLLYASMSVEARDEHVEIRPPIAWLSGLPAAVILRPVPLIYLAELLAPAQPAIVAHHRHKLAEQLVRSRTPA